MRDRNLSVLFTSIFPSTHIWLAQKGHKISFFKWANKRIMRIWSRHVDNLRKPPNKVLGVEVESVGWIPEADRNAIHQDGCRVKSVQLNPVIRFKKWVRPARRSKVQEPGAIMNRKARARAKKKIKVSRMLLQSWLQCSKLIYDVEITWYPSGLLLV